tara:strand:+ start:8 stop:556 length:549 start_codon:yes stop_codon:yes gene_type:complete
MPAYNYGVRSNGGDGVSVDPFYPDGYISTDQDRAQIIAQKKKYEANVQSINFKWPLKSFRRGFFEGNTNTKSAVKEDIKTLLMTAKGERLMHRDMGTTLPVLNGQLFEPIKKIELIEQIKLEVETQIKVYLPFLNLRSVNIFTNEDDDSLKINQIRVSMSYLIRDQQGFSDNMSFTVTDAAG